MGNQRNLKMNLSVLGCGIILVLAQLVVVTVVSGAITADIDEYNNALAQILIDDEIDQYQKHVPNGFPSDVPNPDLLDNIWLDPYCEDRTDSGNRYRFCAGTQVVAGLSKPIVYRFFKSYFTGYKNGLRRSIFDVHVRYPDISVKFAWKITGGRNGYITGENPCNGTYVRNLIDTKVSGRIRMTTNDKIFPKEDVDVDVQIHPLEQHNMRMNSPSQCNGKLMDFVRGRLADFENKYLHRINETIAPIARTKLLKISKTLIQLKIDSTSNQDSE